MTPLSGRRLRLAVDLRLLPADGSPGAGVEHAARELFPALERIGAEYRTDIVPVEWPKRAWSFAREVHRRKADLVLVPAGSVPPFLQVPAIPWVHDVAIFEHPEWFPQSGLKRFITTRLFLRGVRRAPHVFAVSEDTKRELMRVARIFPDDVTVTYQGIRGSASSRVGARTGAPYALVLGTVQPRKNIEFIDGLWPDILSRVPKARLVVAGKNGWGRVPLNHAERVETFDDARRDALLAGASALLLPSLHEGFGRPALEAMALGVPVIASNRGALPEMVGDAGILLDPLDRPAWIRTIVDAFDGRLDGRKGPSRAETFSWEATARRMLAKIAEIC